jgi:hypothetical protein
MTTELDYDSIASLGIRRMAEGRGEMPSPVAVGNRCTLWRFADGTEVIETNGDPVAEAEDGFSELKDAILEGTD